MKPDIVVDIGNSRIKWGRCDGGRVVRVSTLGDDSAEWDGEIGTDSGRLKWAIASVHPDRRDRFRQWIESRGDAVRSLDDFRQIPISNSIRQPGSVGLDRLCACLAARELFGPGPLLVVQAGTAVVINYVSTAGEFLGGLILPGFHLMAKSLAAGTAGLPQVDFDEPMTGYPGQSTAEAIRNGITLSISSVISSSRHLYQRDYGTGKLKVVLTGGDSDLLANLIRPPLELAPALTLEGIRIAAEALS